MPEPQSGVLTASPYPPFVIVTRRLCYFSIEKQNLSTIFSKKNSFFLPCPQNCKKKKRTPSRSAFPKTFRGPKGKLSLGELVPGYSCGSIPYLCPVCALPSFSPQEPGYLPGSSRSLIGKMSIFADSSLRLHIRPYAVFSCFAMTCLQRKIKTPTTKRRGRFFRAVFKYTRFL